VGRNAYGAAECAANTSEKSNSGIARLEAREMSPARRVGGCADESCSMRATFRLWFDITGQERQIGVSESDDDDDDIGLMGMPS
jgi:hypothetical protein